MTVLEAASLAAAPRLAGSQATPTCHKRRRIRSQRGRLTITARHRQRSLHAMSASPVSSTTDVDVGPENEAPQLSALFLIRFDKKVGYVMFELESQLEH